MNEVTISDISEQEKKQEKLISRIDRATELGMRATFIGLNTAVITGVFAVMNTLNQRPPTGLPELGAAFGVAVGTEVGRSINERRRNRTNSTKRA